jgi:hypothetical protein
LLWYVVWQKYTGVSGVLTASIIGEMVLEAASTSETSVKLYRTVYSATIQKTVTFSEHVIVMRHD